MKKYASLLMMLPLMWLWTSCNQNSGSGSTGDGEANQENSETMDHAPEATTSFEKGGLKVYALENSPQFPDAKLELLEPAQGVDLTAGPNQFKFKVQGYELGAQTSDAAGKGLANSDKGQHIHLILNNGPYSAHYEPDFSKELKDGHYVLLAFLSRSYHESVKVPGAFVVQQFVAGQPQNYKEAKLSAPHMFYSRPKGEYYGDDTKKLLLDFFLANCDLSPEGYKVRATINGNDFLLTKWVPYVVEGLPMGEVKIKLELLDKDDNLVPSPFNPVERTCTLAAEKPVM